MATTSGAHAHHEPRPMSSSEKKVIFASSLGTVFEWYDFYLYGSLAAIIGAQFFNVAGADGKPMFDEATRNIFSLLAFAAGFIVRPFGAIVFGRIGDLVGRKYTFLVTILLMGISTFVVAILPSSTSIGIAAPSPNAQIVLPMMLLAISWIWSMRARIAGASDAAEAHSTSAAAAHPSSTLLRVRIKTPSTQRPIHGSHTASSSRAKSKAKPNAPKGTEKCCA